MLFQQGAEARRIERTLGHWGGSAKKKGGSVSQAAPQPNHLKQNRKTDCAMSFSQQALHRNPETCWKSPKGFPGEKGRPKSPKGPPPTQPVYYETQVSASLSAAGLKQSNQYCHYETVPRVALFNHQPTNRHGQ